ncbi:hypothetical protein YASMINEVIRUS_731, partial [Yasminevirus sp. GU-2018]
LIFRSPSFVSKVTTRPQKHMITTKFNKLQFRALTLLLLQVCILSSSDALLQTTTTSVSSVGYDCREDFESAFGQMECSQAGAHYVCSMCIDSDIESKLEWRIRDVGANKTMIDTYVERDHFSTYLRDFVQQATGGFSARFCCGSMIGPAEFSLKFLDNISHPVTSLTLYVDNIMVSSSRISRFRPIQTDQSGSQNAGIDSDNGAPDVSFVFSFPYVLDFSNSTIGNMTNVMVNISSANISFVNITNVTSADDVNITLIQINSARTRASVDTSTFNHYLLSGVLVFFITLLIV